MLSLEPGGERMSRRRTGARFVPVTISLQPSMLDEIEAKLGPKQSRSAWIARCVRTALDDETDKLGANEASTGYLMSLLSRRKDLNGEQKGILEYWLSNWNTDG